MSKQIEALKQALDALEAHADIGIKSDKAITAIREALAEQPAQQKPVAWRYLTQYESGASIWTYCAGEPANRETRQPLYTSPQPSKPWVGLTDEEMHACWDSPLTPLGMKHARMIEAKLKGKNG